MSKMCVCMHACIHFKMCKAVYFEIHFVYLVNMYRHWLPKYTEVVSYCDRRPEIQDTFGLLLNILGLSMVPVT